MFHLHRPAGGTVARGAKCTTARHLGEERKKAGQLSCRCGTGGALETSGCYLVFIFKIKNFLIPSIPKDFKERSSIVLEHFFAKCTLSSCECSLSSPLPSSLQPHWLTPGGCLSSTNLAYVTLFPFSVQSMVLIILEFCLFWGGVIKKSLKTFQLSFHLCVFQRDSGNDFSNNGYSRQGEMRDTASAERL